MAYILISLLCIVSSASAGRTHQWQPHDGWGPRHPDLSVQKLTDDLSFRPTIPGFTFVADNKWSPNGDIPGGCQLTWQQCADLCSNTPNAAGFVYQDWALGTNNCCFLKFFIWPAEDLVPPLLV